MAPNLLGELSVLGISLGRIQKFLDVEEVPAVKAFYTQSTLKVSIFVIKVIKEGNTRRAQ